MKKPRKKHITHAVRYELTKARIRKVYQLYKKTLSLKETGRVLGYTREWVRAMLAKGQRRGVIQLLPAATLRFNAALAKIDKSELTRAVQKSANAGEILARYKLNAATLKMLLNHHGLNYREIKSSCAREKDILQYMHVLNTLKRHPSTYELQKNCGNLYGNICRHWESMEKFRSAHGFPVPAQANTQA